MAANDSSAFYGKGYSNTEDAAAAALQALGYQPGVAGREYMGLIVRNPADGLYYRTNFNTDDSRDHSSWTGRPGGKVSAIVHSHPEEKINSHYQGTSFSTSDIETARQMGVPSFIAAMDLSGVSKERMYTPEPNSKLTPAMQPIAGQRFLAEIPIDEMVKRHTLANSVRQPLDENATLSEEGIPTMGDTVKPGNPAVTGKQRLAMVNAMTDGSMPGSQGSPPTPQLAGPKPRAKDMGGAPQPLPPGTSSFGAPMGAPAPSGLSPEQERAALIAALIRSNHHNNGTPTPMGGAPQ